MAYTAIPSLYRQATTNNYISSSEFVNGTDGIIDADRGQMLVERYGSQNLTGLLEMLGNKAPVDSTTFYHYEEDWLHKTVTGTADAATSNNATTFTVANADALFESQDTNDAVSRVRLNDIVMNIAGDQFIVTDVTDADTSTKFTVTAVGTATAFAQSDAVEFAIVGNAYAEGTDQPEGLTPGLNEYKNHVQIMKEAYEVSGSALTEKIWFEVEDPATGRTGYLWALKGEGDTFRRFNNYCETQMIVGKAQAPSTGLAMTEGLEQFARGGHIEPTAISSAETALTFIDNLVTQLDSERGAKENLVIMGIELAMAFDKNLSIDERFTNGGISYGAFNGSQEVATGFGIDSFYRAGYTFHKMKYDPFSYPQMLGAVGYKSQGCVIPMDSQRDAQTRSSIPSLRIRYKAAEGYSREMEHWMEGGAGLDVKTNGLDVLKLNYRTERGFEGFAANRFIWIDPVS